MFAKLVLWFLLSAVILLGTYAALFRIQFDVDLDSPLRGSVGSRALDVAWGIALDLSQLPSEQWAERLEQAESQHELRVHLVEPRGRSLVPGRPDALPAEARRQLAAVLPPHERQRPPRRAGGPPPGVGQGPPGGRRGPPGGGPGLSGVGPSYPGGGPPPPGVVVRSPADGGPDFLVDTAAASRANDPSAGTPQFTFETSAPDRYWVGVRVSLSNEGGTHIPAFILMESDSITGGGLFWDPFPWVLGAVGFVVLAILLWLPLARSLVVPLRRVTAAAERMAEGDFDVRVDARRRDELGSLGHSINRMAERLDGYIKGQKRFLGDIAHELASPIGRLQLSLGIIEQRADAEGRPRVERALREVANLSTLINELLSFTRAEIGNRRQELAPVNLREVAAVAIEREGSGVEIYNDVPADLMAMAVPDLLVRSLSNLVRNAVRYAADAGPITVIGHSEGDEVVLSVRDAGPGVDAADLDHLFKPFFRAEASRNRETGGVGLGLAIVDTCATACEGTVSAANLAPRGFAVTVRLRLAEVAEGA